ncbi:MAG TPA: aminopeptidase P family protein [Candidatus Krumholzibacteria bacterium]|nr:aminopeptidase P family protein [Candidatus Krumholzibacteria bacterium]HRX49964.1 aminopeptidase P family protein [Candidatus Krumholzibacteria bacterium]
MQTATWKGRRAALREAVADGIILLPGNDEAPRNYADNPYPFRQDSHFLYYVGTDHPGMAALLLPEGREILFGAPEHPDDVVWFGPHPTLGDFAAQAGMADHRPLADLPGILAEAARQGVTVHYLPPYREANRRKLADWLGVRAAEVAPGASAALTAAVVAQREVKTDAEVAEMEYAIGCSALMYRTAMQVARAGLQESRIMGMIAGVALMEGLSFSFPPIVTVHGEVLHNHGYGNLLKDGDLLLIDSGVESPGHYCSDITRTLPVGGVFTRKQRDVYEVVLEAQRAAIEAVAPGATNLQVHLAAARATASGLKDLGLMQGDVDEAVAAGAHALFFPHGIGHMIGLDVHDMEDLGDAVGYDPGVARSGQFGLGFLRLAKTLRPGFAVTIEPGVYFIPALMERWRAAGTCRDFIRYDRLEGFAGFGGIRIEDDVLVTEDGRRVLGTPIPKTPDDIEVLMSAED